MIDVITVIVLNPANPAAEPEWLNWVCWGLSGRGGGAEESGESKCTEADEGCCHALKWSNIFPAVLRVDGGSYQSLIGH